MSQNITKEEIRQFLHIKDKYIPVDLVGRGTFSTVYKAIDIKNSTPLSQKFVALKNITRTTAPNRVADELKILKDLKGMYNCVKLIGCFRVEDQIIAIFPHVDHTEMRDFLADCNIEDIKYYMYNLLIAVDWMHKNKIIHRDIKPSNFLYDKVNKKGILIDFGLAQYENYNEEIESKFEEKKKSILFQNQIMKNTQPPGYIINDGRENLRAPRGGTRGFRAPEVLFRVKNQSTKIDIWSVGVIMLIITTKQYPFFFSADELDALVELGTIFGQNEMRKIARYYGRVWKSNISSMPLERVDFEELIGKLNSNCNLEREGYDLLYMLLEPYDHKRISADAALEHPFFNDVRR